MSAHLSVLLDEVVEAVAPAPGRLVVDGTFGAGGYSRAFLQRGAEVVAFDRDPAAAAHAEPLRVEYGDKLVLLQRRFSELEAGLADAGRAACDAVALDIGVSSMQLDEAERGFSFMRDGPLDMRMSGEGPAPPTWSTGKRKPSWRASSGSTAKSGNRDASRGALVRRRAQQPFTRTLDLAETVEKALGGRRGAPVHPATRVFQALRIAVNEELAELEAGLAAAERILSPGGRLAVVTFHSLEDRIVKRFLTERSGNTPAGSRHLPPGRIGPEPSFDLLWKGAREPGQGELAANPRARSAKLRAGVRTAAAPWPEAGVPFGREAA